MFNEEMYKGYKNLFTKMLHNDETKDHVYQILQEEGLPPGKKVASVAKMVTSEANKVVKRNNKEVSPETLMGSAIYLASDIMDIAEKGGFFQVGEGEQQGILEASNKAVFNQSIKDELLDPVDLQEMLNDGMPEDLKEAGLSQEGIPNEADETVAMEQYALGREKTALSKQQEGLKKSPQAQPETAQDQPQTALGGQNGIS